VMTFYHFSLMTALVFYKDIFIYFFQQIKMWLEKVEVERKCSFERNKELLE